MSDTSTFCVVGRRGTVAWRRRCCIVKIQSILPAQVRSGLTMTIIGRPPCPVTTFDVSTWPCPTVAVPPVFWCTTDLPFTAMWTRPRVVIRQYAGAPSLLLSGSYYSCCWCCNHGNIVRRTCSLRPGGEVAEYRKLPNTSSVSESHKILRLIWIW